MIDISKYQDEDSGSDDGAALEDFMKIEEKEQDCGGVIPLTLQLQMRIQDGILTNSSNVHNNDTLTDIFDDNSDTENTTNGGNRLKSSNASLWSVEDEEDWGDLEIPSSHSLTWVAKEANSSVEKLSIGDFVAPAAENWDEAAANSVIPGPKSARHKASSLLLLEADTCDDQIDDFEDGLDFGDDDEKLSLKLKPSFNILCEGLQVEDIEDETNAAQSNESGGLNFIDGVPSNQAEVLIPSVVPCPNPNPNTQDDAPKKAIDKKKPMLITLEMMQEMSLTDFQSKVESKKTLSSRTRSTSRESQASVTITTTKKVSNIKPSSSFNSSSKKDTRNTVAMSESSSAKIVEKSSTAAVATKRPPRNFSRQSSTEEMDKKRSAWVSSIKVAPPKPILSQISERVSDQSLSSNKTLPLKKGTRTLTNSREDVRKPPMMASSSLGDKSMSSLHSGPASNKVFVKRNSTSSSLVKTPTTPASSSKSVTPRDSSKKIESTTKLIPSIRPSITSNTGGPPERWSSGSSRDMKRPPTHRVAFGRTLKDTPLSQPQIRPKIRKQPTLIRNLGNSEKAKVVGSMVYDPIAKKWSGNEQSLQIFDKPAKPTIKPTLIPHTPKQQVEKVGGMVFDPVKCVWVGNEEDSHLFDEIDAFEKADPGKIAAKMGLVCNKALRDDWNSAETRHKLFIGSWYSRACDARFIRDSSRVHLWEIKTALLEL